MGVTSEAEIDQPIKFNLLVFSDFGKLGRTNMVSNCYLKRRFMITMESYLILLALIASPIWWISGVSNLSILLMQSALHLLSKMTPRLHWGHFFDFNKWSKVHLDCLIPPSSEIFILNDPMDLGFIFMSIITPSIQSWPISSILFNGDPFHEKDWTSIYGHQLQLWVYQCFQLPNFF